MILISSSVKIDQLDREFETLLTIYSEEVTQAIKDEAEKHTKNLVKITKDTAPIGKRKKHYKSNITSKIQKEDAFSVTHLWYVKGDDYRLSHLLNNGHATRNGGRVEGTGFISKAEKQIIEEYTKAVEEAIKNGQ